MNILNKNSKLNLHDEKKTIKSTQSKYSHNEPNTKLFSLFIIPVKIYKIWYTSL